MGQPYSDAVVEQDIAALYKTGAIRNVRIFAQPQGDGVKVIVAVQTRSIVREIVIDGARSVTAEENAQRNQIEINQPVNEEQLEKGRQKIIEIYQGPRLQPMSAVQYRVDPIEEKRGTARVVYTINEGVQRRGEPDSFRRQPAFQRKHVAQADEDARARRSLPSWISPAGWTKSSCNRTSTASGSSTRTTATSTSR